ncbi:MAG: aminotransferase class IV [Hydrotalea sp.]|nr:aminotransferase class IV [Hydrotalea sp.]
MSVFAHNLYQPFSTAVVSMHDRGHGLGDGVYEYILAWHGRLIDLEPHLDRLYRSLQETDISNAISRAALRLKIIDFCRQNQLRHGGLYLQITRGTAPRDHYYSHDLKPNLSMMVKHYRIDDRATIENGVAVKSHSDFRWQRRDIKVISLIANCMAKQWARDNGGAEVAFHNDQDIISEGGSSNLWLVDKSGVLRTHIADHEILNGITKLMVEKVARDNDIPLEWRAFTRAECYAGREMFLTSTSQIGVPITMLDDKKIGQGTRGPITKKIQAAITAEMLKQPIIL